MKCPPLQKLTWFAAGVVTSVLAMLPFKPRYIDYPFPTPNGEPWDFQEKAMRHSSGDIWITRQEASVWKSPPRQELFDQFSRFLATKGWIPFNDPIGVPETLFVHDLGSATRGVDYMLYRRDNGEPNYNYTDGHIVVMLVRKGWFENGYDLRVYTENPSFFEKLHGGVW